MLKTINSIPFIGSIAYSTSNRYGPGIGPIHLSSVHCRGRESNLLSCSHTPYISSSSCTHSRDVGVKCEGTSFFIVEFYFYIITSLQHLVRMVPFVCTVTVIATLGDMVE